MYTWYIPTHIRGDTFTISYDTTTLVMLYHYIDIHDIHEHVLTIYIAYIWDNHRTYTQFTGQYYF